MNLCGLVAIQKTRSDVHVARRTVLQTLDVSPSEEINLQPLLRKADVDTTTLATGNRLSFNDL
jgi:hypothetical protein